jgi:hypothetical protein
MQEAMRKKLEKARKFGYLAPGPIKSITSFFAMPKKAEMTSGWYTMGPEVV